MLASVSGAWMSTVSAANSMRAGPALAARAEAPAAEVRVTGVGCGLGVMAARAVAAEREAGICEAVKAEIAGFAGDTDAAPADAGGAGDAGAAAADAGGDV